jgi:hypothetical protein
VILLRGTLRLPARRNGASEDAISYAAPVTHADNPAGRLALALDRARTRPRQDESAAKGWSTVFGVDYPEDFGDLLTHGAELVALAVATRRQVEAFEDEDPEVLLEHFGEVERTLANFQSVVHMPMTQFLDPLKPTGAHSLKLCSSLLHRRSPEPVLPEEVAADLLGRVHALISEVLAADDLDRETKAWVVERLSEVERALRDVEIRGHRGVEESVDRLVGGLRRKPHLLQRLGGSTVAKAVVATVMALDIALNSAANLHELTEGDAAPPSPVVVEIQQEAKVEVELPPAKEAGETTTPADEAG